mgnify:CR=1 FL=1
MSSPISIAGTSQAGGGIVTGSLQSFVSINGAAVVVNGSPIASHGMGSHASAVTANGSGLLRINGIPGNRDGDAATCGDLLTNGSGWVSSD